ncbi:MAG: type II toxin-antitoxin system PemK/MazF family toxin [Bryobacterales bacterium]|nr:type II toxin-antitoxin system PemK/MazF family toxin [Bryobacterales bacterium]
MKPGDVVIGAFPGAQMTKARPAVVLSTENYHLNRPDVIVGIITTQDPRPPSPTDCPVADWTVAGLHAPSWFRLFLVTLPRCGVRKVGRLSPRDWMAVQTCFRNGFLAE